MSGMKQFLFIRFLAGIFIMLTAILVLNYLIILHIPTTNKDAQSKLWWRISGGGCSP